MIDISAYIESGIIDMYVWGIASPEECAEIEKMAANHPEVKAAIDAFGESIENFAMANPIAPTVTVKPFIMATIDYTDRLEKGEAPSFPPIIHEHSQINDYAEWLNRPDMVLPEGITDIYAKIIGYTPEATTIIVWIKDYAPQEVHHVEYEKFLIVEGSCDITIGSEVHTLLPGSVLSIPLYENHNVKITSSIPCKIVLQRIAA